MPPSAVFEIVCRPVSGSVVQPLVATRAANAAPMNSVFFTKFLPLAFVGDNPVSAAIVPHPH
jgi:hypothetical protein